MPKKKVNIFKELKEALENVRDFREGKRLDLRVTAFPPAPKPMRPAEIREIREALDASQALFAHYLNVSANAVRSWEQGVRRPRNATLKLLTIAKKQPRILLQA
ncbi:MAG TPA: helix-turn-helix domain-containing protein [Candidatus Acidoferrales bacterium]|nr:helix-turn-helix domain-containing protein [Candidatus Acidoferrales bacterium]